MDVGSTAQEGRGPYMCGGVMSPRREKETQEQFLNKSRHETPFKKANSGGQISILGTNLKRERYDEAI